MRVMANLGRLDQIVPSQLVPLVNGLNRAVGRACNTSSPKFSIFDKRDLVRC